MEKEKRFEIQKILLGFLLTTIVGGLIAFFAKKLDFDYQQKQNLIQSEKANAQKTFEEVSTLLDTRVYKMRKIIWAYKDEEPNEEINTRWKDYSSFLEVWNNNLNKNFALVSRYFGEEKRNELEVIHGKFRDAGKLFQPLRYTDQADSSIVNKADNLIDLFNPDIYVFDIALLEQIKNENIGVFLKENKK